MSDDVRFEEHAFGAPVLSLVCVAGLIALLLLAWKWRDEVSRSDLPWLLPAPLLLIAATIFYLVGLGSASVVALVVLVAAALSSFILVLTRHRGLPHTRVLLPLQVLLTMLVLELPWNLRIYTIGPQFWLVELALVGLPLVALWLACGRRVWGVVAWNVALFVLGLIQHYVLEFRGTSILPSDILATSTALSVSAGYSYGLSVSVLLGAAALALSLAVCSRLACVPRDPEHSYVRNAGLAALCAALTAALVLVPSYGAAFGADIDYWWSKDWYERQGFLPSFIYAWQDLEVKAPEGYTPEAAEAASERLRESYLASPGTSERRNEACSQFASAPPNILVIQNETFCDLSELCGKEIGYTGPAFWKDGLTDALSRGELAVSVFGGGTCNTEFEVLCGLSLAFLGTAKYPFTMYDLSLTDSLPRDLGALGYRTIGIHPNIASNWNRDRAFEQLGFDEFLTIDDFEGAETFHTHVSDWATYERSLEIMGKASEPVLIFDVTMQNHSGYDTGSIPAELLGNYSLAGLGASDTAELNEFLACIDESDRAFERLIAALRELDEPTVVVMYGDHHPWFSQAIADITLADLDALERAERIHNTCYAIWANYDVAGCMQDDAEDDLSADLLAARLLDLIGAPLTELQVAELGARTSVAALNADGYRDTEGSWHPLDEGTQELSDLHLVEYAAFGATL